MLGLIDDLEQQAEGLALVERETEVDERSRAEYAQVSLAARVQGGLGHQVRIRMVGAAHVQGQLVRAGVDWALVQDSSQEWVLRQAAIARLTGAPARSVSEDAWSVLSRLSWATVLRRVAEEASETVLHFTDGAREEARVVRVGKDFLEVTSPGAPFEVGDPGGLDDIVPFSGLAAIQVRR